MLVTNDVLAPAQARLVNQAVKSPGACFFTGISKGPFFDTDVDIDEETTWGRLYVSTLWVETRAQELGWVPSARLKLVEAELAEIERMLAEREAKLAEYEDLAAVLAATTAKLPNTVVVAADELARERLARQPKAEHVPSTKPTGNLSAKDILDGVPTVLDFVLEAASTAEARQRAESVRADLEGDDLAAIEQFLQETENPE